MKTVLSILKFWLFYQKKNLFLSFLITCFCTTILYGQLTTGSPGKFGIDGDIRNDFRMSGTFTSAGSHDWIKLNSGTGLGIIDTTNTGGFKASLAAGSNITFTKGIALPRYSTVDNTILLDARYGRDQFGYNAGSNADLTSFTGSKNGDNPMTSWSTVPAGTSVADKVDIIDCYAHLRRDGVVISGSNPSHLIANIAVSTVATTGTRYFDAEFFCAPIAYNSGTGLFSNSGPSATGGHTAWSFNPDGTVNQFGDMSISFSFTSSTADEIYVMVWVSQTTFLTTIPAGFNFVSGEYYGATGGYGYAKIAPKSGSVIAWGVGNTTNTMTPPWGSNSKGLGNNSLNNYSTSYDVGQFGEAAIDLTALGVDPILLAGGNPCNPPFTRVLFKSRSSSSYTSNLQDFAGPYPFLDAPQPPKNILTPGILTCTNSSLTLQPQTYEPGAYYRWSTSNGTITGNPETSSIIITKPGKYYLYSSAFMGCNEQVDSVIVGQDNFKPIAAIQQNGYLISDNPAYSSVTLLGKDTTASKYTSAYGSYQGLLWNWTGSNGFSGTTQNITVTDSSLFRLIVTQISNGCKDTAYHYVLNASKPPLGVKMLSFTAVLKNNKALLNWETASEENSNHFIIERSTDGTQFMDNGTVKAQGNSSQNNSYSFIDDLNTNQSKVLYYRLRSVDIDGSFEYTNTRIVRINKLLENTMTIITYPNPVTNELRITNPSNWQNRPVVYELFSANGTVVKRTSTGSSSQTETMNLSNLSPGFYIIRATSNGEIAQQKIIKH
jgi:hypothetical protein